MPKKDQGKKLARQLEGHLPEGKHWKPSSAHRRTTRKEDTDLSDSSEEASRRHNEQIEEEEMLSSGNKLKRQRQEGSSSSRKEGSSSKEGSSTAKRSKIAQEINDLRQCVMAVLQSKTAAEAASFIPKAAAKEAFLPAQPKPEDKHLAKKQAHTHRVKETPSQKESREKKRCQGIVKAWTFSVWLWEGSPPPPAAPAVVLILISNSVSTNLNT
jgi:ABC-type nickel/cobalt efflux system permease component RcnA